MKYMGSKSRHAKHILPIILKNRQPFQWYVEPFVGGANVIDKVDGLRMGNDINPFLIEMFHAVANCGWRPPTNVSEPLYKMAKEESKLYPNNLFMQTSEIGFIGIGSSYSGKFFGGYARGDGRNYSDESARNLIGQVEGLKGTVFTCLDYREMKIPPNSILYLDPPYRGTTTYRDDFDHDAFLEWSNQEVSDGHAVFISEYSLPESDGWTCVWEKEVFSSLEKDTGSKKATERLFTKNK